ncbi:hypothetical protein SAMN05660703_2587 [Cellulophaga tyrosinoxydans]|uniref:Uncharacterized protein n=1 Tax=Cellulophaga tyrosinoxydans TaxID=504486 RepID=A0A1W2BP25_9FLAO|nr:hypothetical protein SAMN05660703_2587 [Cellulophaga tyrosinoxydans]
MVALRYDNKSRNSFFITTFAVAFFCKAKSVLVLLPYDKK